jgi:alkylation response protein AidB-like acyl-CoA dehydrogenase
VIDLVLDELQLEIQKVAAAAAAELGFRSAVGLEGPLWQKLGAVGVFSIGLDEDLGGASCGARAEIIVAEEFGRHLAPVSVIGAMLAGHVLADGGAANGLFDDVITGSRRVALGVDLGEDQFVVDVIGASLVAVIASDHVALYDTTGLDGMATHTSIDDGATIAGVRAFGVPIGVSPGDASLARARLLIAAMAVGVAAAATDAAVGYAKERHQYGKPIGSFQAIKHRCADMAIRLEAARSLVRLTAACFDADQIDLAATSAADAIACDAARLDAASAIQVFGGIGFTAEGGIHRLLRRAWFLEGIAGGAARHFEALVIDAQLAAERDESADRAT